MEVVLGHELVSLEKDLVLVASRRVYALPSFVLVLSKKGPPSKIRSGHLELLALSLNSLQGVAWRSGSGARRKNSILLGTGQKLSDGNCAFKQQDLLFF